MRGMYATTVEKQATDQRCAYPSIWVNHQLRKCQGLAGPWCARHECVAVKARFSDTMVR